MPGMALIPLTTGYPSFDCVVIAVVVVIAVMIVVAVIVAVA